MSENNEELEEHEHTAECLIIDVIDLGDDGDGYVAQEVAICKITGGKWNGQDN